MEDGDLKLRERKFYSYAFDQPGHSREKHTGENHMSSSEEIHQIDHRMSDRNANEVILTCFCRWNVIRSWACPALTG